MQRYVEKLKDFHKDPEVEQSMKGACFFWCRFFHPNQLGGPYTTLLEVKQENHSDTRIFALRQ